MKGLVVSVALALVSTPFAQKPQLLQVRAKVGAVYVYSLDTKMTAVGTAGQMGFKSRLREKLVSAKKGEFEWDQSFKVLSTFSDGVMRGGDKSFMELDGFRFRVVNDRTGQNKRLIVNGMSVSDNGTPNVVLPAYPVKVGDKWSAYVNVNQQRIKIDYRLTAFRREGRRNVAVIEGAYAAGQLIRNITPVIFWVDTADGKMVRAQAEIEATSGPQKVRVKYLLIRI
ncbi:MAG: hypothetical protein H7Y17_08545 [Chlorobia bacterium]|nr:hypothetical protein [Fimbriimonadaceae bacterium]